MGGIELAPQRGGSFYQVRDLGEEGGVRGDFAPYLGSQGVDLALNSGLAFCLVKDNALLFEGGEIIGRVLDGDFFWLQETQSASEIAGLESCKFKGDDGFAMKRQQPADGARKGDVGMIPAHGFARMEVCNQFIKRVWQDFARGHPFLAYHRGNVFAAINF